MIIAIGHESGVGKDTATSLLIDFLRTQNMKGLSIVREGFADRVYDVAYSLYGWAGFKQRQHYIHSPQDKEIVLPLLGKCPRQILIDIAEKLREVDPCCWMNACLQGNTAHLKIVPDLRKVKEFEHCEQHGIYRLRLRIPGRPRSTWTSDRDLYPISDDRWSRTIDNSGTIKELNEKVIEFAKEEVLPVMFKYRSGEWKPQYYKHVNQR